MQNLLLTNRFFLLILLFGFFHINSNAQTFTNKHNLIDDIESLLHSNPDQSLKVAQYLLSKTNTSNKEKAKAKPAPAAKKKVTPPAKKAKALRQKSKLFFVSIVEIKDYFDEYKKPISRKIKR